MPSDDLRADMDKIRAFYADKVARHPDQAGEVRLREEPAETARSGRGESDVDPATDS
jgi:hypothetical protein